MAVYDDLTFGHGRDDILNKLHDEATESFQSDPIAMVSALIGLDEHYGLRQEGDYVLLHPALPIAVMVKFADPELQSAVDTLMDSEEEDTDNPDVLQRATREPFEAIFESPEGDEYTAQYPERIRGKKILLRFMNEAEASQLDFAYTVRADGTVIYLPDPDPRRPVRVQDVQQLPDPQG